MPFDVTYTRLDTKEVRKLRPVGRQYFKYFGEVQRTIKRHIEMGSARGETLVLENYAEVIPEKQWQVIASTLGYEPAIIYKIKETGKCYTK